MKKTLFLITFFALAANLFSQSTAPTPKPKSYPADPKDVESIDAILAATYDSISGDVGEARNWDRFRSLFYPGAKLIPSGTNREGKTGASFVDPDGYIARSEKLLMESGFHEREIARKTDRFGNIAQVFSTYEGKLTLDGKPTTIRGINSFQLLYDGTRWWVINIFWQQESEKSPIPKEYLPKK